MSTTLVVKCTWAFDAPERTHQALNVAAVALAAGASVSLWLAGEAAWLAVPGRAEELELELASPAEELLAAVLAEGSLTVCAQCAARRGLQESDLLPGTRIAGAASFVEEALAPDAKVLVY